MVRRAGSDRAEPSAAGPRQYREPILTGPNLLGHGGSNPLVNGHMRTLDASVERFRPWRGQPCAVDFLRCRPSSASRPRAAHAAYAIFWSRAACALRRNRGRGRRDDAGSGGADENPVNRLGSHVVLRCNAAEIVMAHVRKGSVTVAPGDPSGDRTAPMAGSAAPRTRVAIAPHGGGLVESMRKVGRGTSSDQRKGRPTSALV
jgi:hypothetical protein